ncbi:hypothetical protein Zmor_003772 [Zophobas morio]|uniref:Uncharacterized protein n=1 Tax=Zophobas morio TaxID=2755281 RepID=A0AA38M1M4_9CUCU|nr:hypothetical protein Zmor_003772 [Zophobas morio]
MVKKAHSLLDLLRKTFCEISPLVLSKLYRTYVRPILEFSNSVWTPVLQRDINQLESVQRRATRIPFGRIRPQYLERLSLMRLTTLSERRFRGDLITTYRAVNNPSSPICHLFVLNSNQITRGHSFELIKERCTSTARRTFLTNRVVNHWNPLPDDIVTSQSLLVFKKRYDEHNV